MRDSVKFDADVLRRFGQASVAVADVARSASGVDLADSDEYVDMGIVRGARQLDNGVSVHVQILGEHVAGEGEYVMAAGEPAVVAVTAVQVQ